MKLRENKIRMKRNLQRNNLRVRNIVKLIMTAIALQRKKVRCPGLDTGVVTAQGFLLLSNVQRVVLFVNSFFLSRVFK